MKKRYKSLERDVLRVWKVGKWFLRGGVGMSKYVVVGKFGVCLVFVGEMGMVRWV